MEFPQHFNWRHWVDRWERMQEGYLVRRKERMDLVVRMIRAVRENPERIVDLGCGPGSLTAVLAENFPEAEIWGVDYDPWLMGLAKRRLDSMRRVRLVEADLRDPAWTKILPGPMDAAVSMTALHWFSPTEVSVLYAQIGERLRPGGIFINVDHVGGGCPAIQRMWTDRRARERNATRNPSADDWERFWNAFGQALNADVQKERQAVAGEWRGVEDGMPLAWHMDRLREAGFVCCDCFERWDCDAAYGGIRGS